MLGAMCTQSVTWSRNLLFFAHDMIRFALAPPEHLFAETHPFVEVVSVAS